MTDRLFLDTNILVYLYDTDAPEKQEASRDLFARVAERSDVALVVSTQVLQEFYVTMTRKFSKRMPEREVLRAMQGLRSFPVIQVNVPMIFDAIELGRRFQLSFWDSLIAQAATAAGCSRILTEDLQHQMRIGNLVVENPFFNL